MCTTRRSFRGVRGLTGSAKHGFSTPANKSGRSLPASFSIWNGCAWNGIRRKAAEYKNLTLLRARSSAKRCRMMEHHRSERAVFSDGSMTLCQNDDADLVGIVDAV